MRWRDLPKVTIAQVQGYCIMGGLMLATVCDLIVASEDAKFCDREVRQGGPHIAYASLPWEIGPRKAKEYPFTGDWVTAAEAQRLGLVNHVVPKKNLDAETMAWAQRIAMQDPYALRLGKMSVNMMMDEMGFRNSLLSSFHVYTTFNVAHRQMVAEGKKRPTGVAAARGRDEPFGDHG